jgi:hypothetical protein
MIIRGYDGVRYTPDSTFVMHASRKLTQGHIAGTLLLLDETSNKYLPAM